MTQAYTGPDMAHDIFTLFAELTGYRCMKCNGYILDGINLESKEDLAVITFSKSIYNDKALPIGVVCKECSKNIKELPKE